MKNFLKYKSIPWLKLIFGFLILAFAFILLADKEKSLAVLRQADWTFILPALIVTSISYFFASSAYILVNRIFGLKNRSEKLFKVGFITIAFNNLITLGGAIGYSLRVILLKDEENRGRNIMAASIFFSYLNFLIILLFSLISVAYVLLDNRLSLPLAAAFKIAFSIFLAFLIFLSILMFKESARQKIFTLMAKIIKRITKINLHDSLENISQALSYGVKKIKEIPLTFCLMTTAALADWIGCLFVFWFCFKAFNITISPMILTAGFFLAVIAGLISMIPGGLGVQDLSEAAIYNLLGVPLGSAIAVSIIFRIVYYFAPFSFSLLLYYHLMNKKRALP